MNRKRTILLVSVPLLIIILVVVGISLLTAPKQPTSPISDEEVENIGARYMVEKYGTNYASMGVHQTTFSNGSGTWTYPTAQFRVPPDWNASGIIVYVMVNPETAQIFTTFTSWSKNMTPPPPA